MLQIVCTIFILLCLGVLGLYFYDIVKNNGAPTPEQVEVVKKWLRWVVIEAEKQLGSRTGQLKLHYVYNKAINQFDWIEKYVSFELFSDWVDESLKWAKKQISTNSYVSKYVVG